MPPFVCTTKEEKTHAGLYIHIPFCATKCDYCDFLSFPQHSAHWEAYLHALLQEWDAQRTVWHGVTFDTVFIGGGTPSVWPPRLLAALLAALPAAPAQERTCEANPGTLSPEVLTALCEGGINRLSLGMQAFQPVLLQNIGRQAAPNPAQVLAKNIRTARRLGIHNISLDLMFALPGQTLSHWEETLHAAVALAVPHISAYALTPEEGTPLWERYGHTPCDDATDRAMYDTARRLLAHHGLAQYELSNFARPGFESRHNLGYWTGKPYLGLGLGAHSYDGHTRWHNTTDFSAYVGGAFAPCEVETLSPQQKMAEALFLGLRLTAGVDVTAFAARFGTTVDALHGAWVQKMQHETLLEKTSTHLRLTRRGMDVANYVMAGFL